MKTKTTQEKIDALKQREAEARKELEGATTNKRKVDLESKIRKLGRMEKEYAYQMTHGAKAATKEK